MDCFYYCISEIPLKEGGVVPNYGKTILRNKAHSHSHILPAAQFFSMEKSYSTIWHSSLVQRHNKRTPPTKKNYWHLNCDDSVKFAILCLC